MTSPYRQSDIDDTPTLTYAKPTDSVLVHFEYEHLPPSHYVLARDMSNLAQTIVACVVEGRERSACLRKLLEARDALLRAVTHPGA